MQIQFETFVQNNVGKLVKSSKQIAIWKMKVDSQLFEIKLFESFISGKVKIMINEEVVQERKMKEESKKGGFEVNIKTTNYHFMKIQDKWELRVNFHKFVEHKTLETSKSLMENEKEKANIQVLKDFDLQNLQPKQETNSESKRMVEMSLDLQRENEFLPKNDNFLNSEYQIYSKETSQIDTQNFPDVVKNSPVKLNDQTITNLPIKSDKNEKPAINMAFSNENKLKKTPDDNPNQIFSKEFTTQDFNLREDLLTRQTGQPFLDKNTKQSEKISILGKTEANPSSQQFKLNFVKKNQLRKELIDDLIIFDQPNQKKNLIISNPKESETKKSPIWNANMWENRQTFVQNSTQNNPFEEKNIFNDFEVPKSELKNFHFTATFTPSEINLTQSQGPFSFQKQNKVQTNSLVGNLQRNSLNANFGRNTFSGFGRSFPNQNIDQMKSGADLKKRIVEKPLDKKSIIQSAKQIDNADFLNF